MSQQQRKKTQKTRPKKGEPVEIPVPERREFFGILKRAAKNSRSSGRKK